MKKILLCGLFALLFIISPAMATKAMNDYFEVEYNFGIEPGFIDPAGSVDKNDILPDGYWEVQIVEQPRHGEIIWEMYPSGTQGTIGYLITEEGYHGRDTFKYCIFDGKSYSNNATVIITIIPMTFNGLICNGKNAIYYTSKDTPLSGIIPCPSNPNDYIPYALLIGNIDSPEKGNIQHGQLILTSLDEGSEPENYAGKKTFFEYIPDPGFSGVDTFTYTSQYDSGRYSYVWGLPGHVTIYVGTPVPAPEFPSTILPVTLIIGVLGSVLYIQRTKEH